MPMTKLLLSELESGRFYAKYGRNLRSAPADEVEAQRQRDKDHPALLRESLAGDDLLLHDLRLRDGGGSLTESEKQTLKQLERDRAPLRGGSLAPVLSSLLNRQKKDAA